MQEEQIVSNFETRTDKDLAILAAEGNADATDALLARYKDAVRSKARKFYMLGGDQDDIIQEGMIGLFKAIQTYDPAGGASFKTYMNICVHNQILNAIEAATAKKHTPLNSSGDLSAAWDIPADVSSNPDELAIYSDTMQLILSGRRYPPRRSFRSFVRGSRGQRRADRRKSCDSRPDLP